MCAASPSRGGQRTARSLGVAPASSAKRPAPTGHHNPFSRFPRAAAHRPPPPPPPQLPPKKARRKRYLKILGGYRMQQLQAELQEQSRLREALYEKCSKYLELRNILTVIEENELQEMKTQVNIGCDFYMQAEV
eukprot:SAG22_NODE_3687_length_1578_cov_1.597701_2_plen_134_part_00